jgi:hypothetical protein
LRCLTFPKLLAAASCVLVVLGIAIMISAGVGTYCNAIESDWKYYSPDYRYPGCSHIDSKYHATNKEWPSNGFLTMEVMMGGIWATFLFWVAVLGLNVRAYFHGRKQASFGFQEMPDTATSPPTS